ncbi:sulfatase-like hydrolase/transferase [Microbulbifer variabilis]|uniref:Sulfatase-like hydrolase/transferase n=1 Tax=Microbulbifer variabilis TaxID=266805 RepID=A0ABY4VKV5_9GAMM|nr:sulfatase-like hydrolase/transferase [Microbulbifer variabilis]USD23475.1 sulfatase-like hydrolase/transferase [Microbulbifer variabilis]
MKVRQILIGLLVFLSWMPVQAQIVHDAEYYVLKMQNGERWQQEDSEITRRLQALRDKYGQPPNIVFLLWDDTAFGAVGFPALQKNFGYSTPNLNKMAAEGINFTRMYSEPSCTPTRAAVLTGRHPVRYGMGAVGMPHEFSGLRAEEVTIAEVLSRAGYATGFFGKGHLGDIEESYLHNQGFDEALFTPMNQITSLFNPQANAVNAVLGMFPEIYPPDPYRLDNPGLVPTGWVMNIEGEKGQPGREWCGTSNECFSKFDPEAERRTIAFIRKNAEANKPFFVAYWPNFLNFMAAFMPKPSVSGLMVADSFPAVDDFAGQLMAELQALGIAENTLFVAMADNGPMVHSPPAGWGMLPMLYRGGKGDFTEGGVRVPAFAWWPGMVQPGQVVGDIIHIADLYTTFARLAGASEYIPTDRVVDGLDQTALLLNGDTHSRRDYVFIYTGNQLGATVKGRYKRHWIGAGEVASSGMPEAYYDLYMDPREEYPQLVPLIYTQGQFNHMVARHRLFKKKYPDVPSGKGIPYTGLANARPETKAIGQRVRAVVEEMPFSIEEYLEFQIPGADKVGDWGH